MPEVIGYTTDAVDALIAHLVATAAIDNATGVMTLTLHDGTVVSIGSVLTAVPAATTSVSGTVELATDVETQAGTDSTRGVTPFGLHAVISAITTSGLITDLLPANYTQTTVLGSYPSGYSRIYFDNVNSTGWDFVGNWGELLTYRQGTDYARQFYTRHNNGISSTAEMWLRTASGANSWTKWTKMVTGDTDAIARLTPANGDVIQRVSGAWANRTPAQYASTINGAGLPIQYYGTGGAYAAVSGPGVYVGPTDPGAVANGSIWLDTTGT